MPEKPNAELIVAMTRIVDSRHPYVNNTLKRLAKAARTRINGQKPTTA